MIPLWILAVVCSLCSLSLHRIYQQITLAASRRKIIKTNACEAPTELPHKDPILSLDIFVENYRNFQSNTFLEGAQARFAQYGNTFHNNVMGANAIFTIEPENIKTVLSKNFQDYSLGSQRKTAFEPLLGHGIFTTDGDEWAHSRRLLRPNFARNKVANLGIFEKHVKNLIRAIPHDQSQVDLQELFFRFTIDTATEFFCGESSLSLCTGQEMSAGGRFANAFDRSQRAIGENMFLGKLANVAPATEFKKDRDNVYQFIDHFVQKALESKIPGSSDKGGDEWVEDRYFFVHELAQQTTDPVRLREELLNVILAGRDTTASLLSNFWFVLANRPDVWEKLQEEVRSLNGAAPTFDHLKEMKYLRYCLNESLRLNPPVPVNWRTAVKDTVLPIGGGDDGKAPILVTEGTIVNYHVFSMHRREDFYGADAADFKPERWENLRPGWEYLPFNGGPRICIGQQLALTEASYTTVRLLQEFSTIESRDPEPWHEALTLTCASGNGTKVALQPFKRSASYGTTSMGC